MPSAAAPRQPPKALRKVQDLRRPYRRHAFRALRIGGIEQSLQLRVYAPRLPDHQRGPIEIFPPPERRPVGRREIGEVAEVGDLVGQLDQLGAARGVGGVFYLLAFALGLGQRLVVGDGVHVGQHLRAEAFVQQAAALLQ